jgi:hypothetical protein
MKSTLFVKNINISQIEKFANEEIRSRFSGLYIVDTATITSLDTFLIIDNDNIDRDEWEREHLKIEFKANAINLKKSIPFYLELTFNPYFEYSCDEYVRYRGQTFNEKKGYFDGGQWRIAGTKIPLEDIEIIGNAIELYAVEDYLNFKQKWLRDSFSGSEYAKKQEELNFRGEVFNDEFDECPRCGESPCMCSDREPE